MSAIGIVVSCQGATQVVIEARTNVAHRPGLVTAFTVGSPQSIETAESTTETNEPWGSDGFIGSLVTVPGGEKDAPLAVKLVMGVHRESRDCLPPKYEGCIVARRKLRYIPHERLLLPIALYAQCEGVPCDQDTTCNALGQCVPAAIDPNACTGPDGCTIPGDPPPSTVTPDAAPPVTDGGSDATLDVVPDGAASDATNDAPPLTDATTGFIDCPGAVAFNNRCKISLGQVCCFNASTQQGSCVASCQPNTIDETGNKIIYCDDDTDCQQPQRCCRPTAAPVMICQDQCNGPMNIGLTCHATGVCPPDRACSSIVWGYYRMCQ